MRTTRRNSLARYRSIEGVRTSEIVYRGGHVKRRNAKRAAQLRNEIPELPGFLGKTGIYRSHLGKGDAANRVPRCDLSWFFPWEKGEKETRRRGGKKGRREKNAEKKRISGVVGVKHPR